MKDVIIKSFIELITFFETIKKPQTTIFRGQANIDWSLLPKSGRKEYNRYTPQFSEREVFESWKRYALHFINKEPINDWDWLALAQHHGLATRLLDWTKNPLTAAFFAVSEQFDSDGAIYIHVIKKDYNPKIEDPFAFKGVGVFFPKGLSARILSQRGLFTISGTPSTSLDEGMRGEFEKVIIAKEAKQEIIRSLDRYGVNELSIFQDLDSLSNYLNTYVQKLTADDLKLLLLINDE